MTKADREAVRACAQDLIKNGVDEETAKVVAKAYLDCGIIKPVVNY